MQYIMYPFTKFIEVAYSGLYSITNNYGFSLVLLSFVTSIIMYFIKKWFSTYTDRENLIQGILQPQIEEINKQYTGLNKHEKVMKLYKRYSYHPLMSLRLAIPIFIQLPFLFAAYHVLNNYSQFAGESFWIIRNLASPDKLIDYSGYVNLSLNVLPILMTLVNVSITYITPNFGKKGRVQAVFIALLFLVLLYTSSSALLLYWTMNNVLSLVGATYQRFKYNKEINYNYKEKLSLSYISNRLKDFINDKKVLENIKIYLFLIALYPFIVMLGTGMSLIMDKRYLYVFALSSFLLYIINSIVVYKNFDKKKSSLIGHSLLLIVAFAILVLSKKNIIGTTFLDSLLYISIIGVIISLLPNIIRIGRSNLKSIFSLKKSNIPILVYSLTPILFLALNNQEYLFGGYYLLYLFVMLVVTLLLVIIVNTVSNNILSEYQKISLISIYIFTIIALPIIRSTYSGNNTNYLDVTVLIALGFIIAKLISTEGKFKLFTVVGSTLLILTFISPLYSVNLNTVTNYTDNSLAKIDDNIVFKDSSSVYLLVYDGSPNERTYDILGLDKTRIKNIFKKFDLKWYKDTYTLGEGTLKSMSSMLNISNAKYARDISDYQARQIYAGNSNVNRVFNRNNYSTYKLLNDGVTGDISDSIKNRVDEFYPPRESMVNSNLDFLVVLLRGVFQGELKFDTYGINQSVINVSDYQEKKKSITMLSNERKFVVNHLNYPSHTPNSGRLTKKDTINWLERLEISYDLIEEDFSNILNNDSNSIIIAIGDHGGYLTGDGFRLKKWAKEDITEDLIWDRIGTMIAIYWPDKEKAAKYDKNLVTNADVFPVVFSYLTDDSQYLKLRPERIFEGFKIKFKEGNLIE